LAHTFESEEHGRFDAAIQAKSGSLVCVRLRNESELMACVKAEVIEKPESQTLEFHCKTC